MGAGDGTRWWECIGDVARGLRTIPTRSTGFSPHFVVFKQQPVLPLVPALRVSSTEDLEAVDPTSCADLAGVWGDLYRELASRQRRYDAGMLEQYQRRTDLATYDVRFIFSPGDNVLLR